MGCFKACRMCAVYAALHPGRKEPGLVQLMQCRCLYLPLATYTEPKQ